MSCGSNISSTHWDRLVELVTAKVCWKLGGAQLAGPARCIGSWKPVGGSGEVQKVHWKPVGGSGEVQKVHWKPVGGSGKGAKGALEASWRVWQRCKRCIGSWKPVGGSVGTLPKRPSPQISGKLVKLGLFLLAKTRGTDSPHSKKFPTSTF
jgi:hypothetical protein